MKPYAEGSTATLSLEAKLTVPLYVAMIAPVVSRAVAVIWLGTREITLLVLPGGAELAT